MRAFYHAGRALSWRREVPRRCRPAGAGLILPASCSTCVEKEENRSRFGSASLSMQWRGTARRQPGEGEAAGAAAGGPSFSSR